MLTFEELYRYLLKNSVQNGQIPVDLPEHNALQLDCLLNPQKHPVVIHAGDCDCDCNEESACVKCCLFKAIVPGEGGKPEIDVERCVGCGHCIDACKGQKLTQSRDVLPAFEAIRNAKGPVYALIAPAFLGQFSAGVTPGKLRSALKKIGFHGMLEVALFADILTLKEALEFDRNILTEDDYQITSCCCPLWIALIRKIYNDLIPHVPASVSPMIACGRMVKKLHPDAVTVFIGPCVAKKAEAREKDLAGAVDYVLTFQEMRDVFDFAEINPVDEPESESDHSSRAGRIYAHAGGVSEAVKGTLEKLSPMRAIALKAKQADGIPACRAMVEELLTGKDQANFYEGMGCVGGCVGGPKILIDREAGRENVIHYGDEAIYKTPVENPHVIELLKRLGFETPEELLHESDLFSRKFAE